MTINEIRHKYLDFFKQKGHTVIPSASLIPENDPSVLFTTAGMHPLVPFLMGEKHPAGKRLVNYQKCIRTGDIDEVGDSSHLTFFEMLGNWSLGDYWKKEAVEWSYEFLTDKKWLGLDKQKIAISIFKGDKDSPFDEESFNLWKGLGIPESRIARIGKAENWWPAGGQSVGPQGPCTEMFYWTGKGQAPEVFNINDEKWFEIWNDVFMEFERTKDGKYKPLKQKNVDTGMGLERTAAVLQGKTSVYEIESLKPLMEQIKSIAEDYQEVSARIIVDHLRAGIFILSAGIVPSNVDQGYVVRKLIRRAIRHAKKIGIPIEVDVTTPIVKLIVKQFKDIYPELKKSEQRIIDELNKEEDVFEKVYKMAPKEMTKIYKRKIEERFDEFVKKANKSPLGEQVDPKSGKVKIGNPTITAQEAYFELYDKRDIPLDKIIRLSEESGLVFVDIEGFNKLLKNHELSRKDVTGKGLKEVNKLFEEFVKESNKSPMIAQKIEPGRKIKVANPLISGHEAFNLYSTYGFPIELIKELAEEKGLIVDEEGFEEEMKKHKELSQDDALKKGIFKGGLVDKSEQAIKYHTATHLLHQALRQVLGDHVEQRGSNITDKRLRFDFSHSAKMTDEEKQEVENIVNQKIKENLPVSFKEMSVDEAKKAGAIGLFGDKYGEKVKVFTIGKYSKEICGGPHIKSTGELGKFRIKKEEASSAGVRRIKAVLE